MPPKKSVPRMGARRGVKRNADDDAGSEADLDLGSWKPFFLRRERGPRLIFTTPESISFKSGDSSGTRSLLRAGLPSIERDSAKALIRPLLFAS